MRVLIFEPGQGGHRLQYIRSMLPAIAPLAQVIIAMRQDVPAMEETAVMLGDVRAAGDVIIDASVPIGDPGKIGTQWGRIGALKRIVAAHNPDRIYIPSADGLAQVMGISRMLGFRGLPRAMPAEALILRGAFAYPSPAGLKQRLKSQATWIAGKFAPYTTVHLLDPIVHERVVRDDSQASDRFRLMPEPVETPENLDKHEARRKLGIPEQGRYVGCSGFIDFRKGIDLMLRAFRDGLSDPDDRLLLAGPQGPGVAEMLQGEMAPLVRSGRIIAMDRLFESQEVGDALKAMDLVVTPYRNHIGSASILIRAAAANLPVLSTEFGWMGMVTKRFGLGDVCNVQDAPALARAMKVSLDRAADFKLGESAKRFVAFHTVENFGAHWAVNLRSAMGFPQAGEIKTWEWVMEAVEAS